MPFIVLTGELAHESNTFSVRPADYAAFEARGVHLGASAIEARGGANTPLGGFLEVGSRHGWTIHHTISAMAQPCGPVTRDAFDRLAHPIIEGARQHKGALHGVLLGLHGAMVTTFCEDGEGELLARLRDVLGPDLPIGITLDPHANVTAQMTELAQIIVSYKTYPHVDMRVAGVHAAEILQRTMAKEINPRTIRAHRPMLEEVNGGRTDVGPMLPRLAKAREYERQADVFAVSVNGGFGNADIEEVGPTVLVTGQGDFARHQAFAESIMDDIWNCRNEMITSFLEVNEAARQAAAFDAASGPLVIADYADNPGGGGYGDSTNLLAALLAVGLKSACFGPIVDPEAANALHRRKIGDMVSLLVGGKTDPGVGGPPLTLTGELTLLSNGEYVGDGPMIGGLGGSWGPTAVLKVGEMEILIVTNPAQMLDLQQFRSFGIDPAAKRVVALKSMQHFRAAFEPIAGKVIVCDSGALCTPDLTKLTYRRARRPIFPLNKEMIGDQPVSRA